MLMALNPASPMRVGATAIMQGEYRSEEAYRKEVAKYAKS
jgi:hypothetical protein